MISQGEYVGSDQASLAEQLEAEKLRETIALGRDATTPDMFEEALKRFSNREECVQKQMLFDDLLNQTGELTPEEADQEYQVDGEVANSFMGDKRMDQELVRTEELQSKKHELEKYVKKLTIANGVFFLIWFALVVVLIVLSFTENLIGLTLAVLLSVALASFLISLVLIYVRRKKVARY
mmetsp:Transcript_18754/g.30626  ORF Transcript_18754/g.30626 Transcript_18754/m.30626 type:complete len:180 (+) Transcript_18754:391-930(+)